MLDGLALNADTSEQLATAGFKGVCRQFLLDAQNSDGGWSYQPGLGSAVEPTCWALLSLKSDPGSSQAVRRGLAVLKESQLPDGSWPARAGQQIGCWVTSLASLGVFLHEGDGEPVRRGLNWLCSAWPAESRFSWRARTWLRPTAGVAGQDSSLAGWSWTPGAASWVEPTAYALMALNIIPEKLHPPLAPKRRRLGQAMLYDRMCPGGGWNSGNPMVYGVPGERRVRSTAWALLALKGYATRAENEQSLLWLEEAYHHIAGPGSLALASICLESYGRPQPGLEARLASLYEINGFLENIPAATLSLMALSPEPNRLFADGCRCRSGL